MTIPTPDHVATLRDILSLARSLAAADEVPLKVAGERIADIVEAQQMLYDLPLPTQVSTPDKKGRRTHG
jgi:hypothetical protein